MTDPLGSELSKSLPHALGAARFTGMYGDGPPGLAPAAEVIDEGFSRPERLVTREIQSDDGVFVRKQRLELPRCRVGTKSAAQNSDELDLDRKIFATGGDAVDDGFDDGLAAKIVGRGHEGGTEAELHIVKTLSRRIFDVLVSDAPARVGVPEHARHALHFFQEGEKVRTRFEHLKMRPQRGEILLWQRHAVFMGELEAGLQAKIPVEVPVQIDARDSGRKHGVVRYRHPERALMSAIGDGLYQTRRRCS